MSTPVTVLVVEDEPLIMMNIVTYLVDQGFIVLEAQGADEAISLLEAHDDVRIMFTDVDMPGTVDGFQLARIARTMFPPVMVIVVSGGVRPGFSGLAPDARFVPKPYKADLIIRMIHETTGAHWLGAGPQRTG